MTEIYVGMQGRTLRSHLHVRSWIVSQEGTPLKQRPDSFCSAMLAITMIGFLSQAPSVPFYAGTIVLSQSTESRPPTESRRSSSQFRMPWLGSPT